MPLGIDSILAQGANGPGVDVRVWEPEAAASCPLSVPVSMLASRDPASLFHFPAAATPTFSHTPALDFVCVCVDAFNQVILSF